MHRLAWVRAVVVAGVAVAAGIVAKPAWAGLPPVDSFPDRNASAPEDAAVVVGIEKYFAVDAVPYAARDAQAFWTFLVNDRGVPVNHVSLLKDTAGANDRIEKEVDKRAAQVGPNGTLWFFFAGHGAPDPDGKDGLLVGVDAQQTLDSVKDRSVSRQWLMTTLNASKAKHVVVFLDACFSGKGKGGSVLAAGLRPLIPTSALAPVSRSILVTGARSDQVSGPLDEAQHGLFTYFLLGALRGWGLPSGRGPVRLEAAFNYVKKAMAFALANGDREQEPELTMAPGAAEVVLAEGMGEKGPDLAKLSAGLSLRSAPAPSPAPTPSPAPAPVPALQPSAGAGTVYYYAGDITIRLTNGTTAVARQILRHSLDPARGIIQTHSVIQQAGQPLQEAASTWAVTGSQMVITQSVAGIRGRGTLSGQPWSWSRVDMEVAYPTGIRGQITELFDANGLNLQSVVLNARGKMFATDTGYLTRISEAQFNSFATAFGATLR